MQQKFSMPLLGQHTGMYFNDLRCGQVAVTELQMLTNAPSILLVASSLTWSSVSNAAHHSPKFTSHNSKQSRNA